MVSECVCVCVMLAGFWSHYIRLDPAFAHTLTHTKPDNGSLMFYSEVLARDLNRPTVHLGSHGQSPSLWSSLCTRNFLLMFHRFHFEELFSLDGDGSITFSLTLTTRFLSILYCFSRMFTKSFRGVPQGSILGPLLFDIYTSILERVVVYLSFDSQWFSDDTRL